MPAALTSFPRFASSLHRLVVAAAYERARLDDQWPHQPAAHS
jgi:hypothetical protein